ncbi:MAG: 30S ribosomal protein S20, partial [Bdellovibrionota bacterium]|nr:30S ribosomal protein S20 [Bdellovibrionota bacterium]
MANHKSAAKRARQSNRRMEMNKIRKSEVKTAEKSLRTALTEKNK